MARRIIKEVADHIKQFEGLVLFAYDDFDPPGRRRRIQPGDRVNGTLTIGYGHTGRDVVPGMTILERHAHELFDQDIRKFERCVERSLLGYVDDLPDYAFGALVSFCYNVGENAYLNSTLLKKVRARDYGAVPKEFMKWVNSKGKRMQGLVNRRSAEVGLWAKGSFVASNTVPTEPVASGVPAKAATTGAVGTVGGVTALEPAVTKIADAWSGQSDNLTSGDYLRIAIGAVILFVTLYLVYKQLTEE